ncbi:hypothetical protein LAZ67_6003528 [Cordylochernes scorpioides]|uniref:Retrovirus-related Pol polyprotein from transposon TNT 1-94 n=1 Tax=Cordylochernes scorpioides TaxID=51811 RepID=A0ABY6KKM9_9ARAC|nr:hypothetical protein LAZ67_6003528 [Cordylochernes scorpioides]
MTLERDYFTCLKECTSNMSSITVANGSSIEACGIGTVSANIVGHKGDASNLVAQNTLYVPDMRHSVLCVLQMIENGRKVVFNKSGCHIMDMKDQNDRVSLASECKEELTLELWHKRLMHVNAYTIAKMAKNQSEHYICQGLPKASWAELTYTAAYVRNRVLNNHNGESTPYELWIGNKPSLKHIRAIGCQVFVHIPRQVRKSKLERRAVKGNLVGYALRGRGYRVWIPEMNKVVESRNCVFKESDVSRNDSNRSTEVNKGDPTSYKEAIQGPEAEHLLGAIEEELESLRKHKVWELTELPKDSAPIACKWVLHTKTNAEGQVVRYKARLVAKGFTQQKGNDYDEIYSPVSSFETTRLLTAIGVENNWFIDQYDVKIAYLYGKLDRVIYMEQPEGFVKPGEEHLYCQLKRSLYGLKQSGRCWNKCLDEWLKKKGFMRNPVDPCVYKLKLNEGMIILSLYVDDILTLTENQEVREKCIEMLRGHFETKYIGPVSYLLGVNFTRSKGGCVTLTHLQEGREVSTPMETRPELLEEEDEENCQDLPYRELIGGLLYISQRTRPDIAYAWPARSLEHIWDVMGRRLQPSRNVDYLARQLETIWQEIPQHTIWNLYQSMTRRVAACIQAVFWLTPDMIQLTYTMQTKQDYFFQLIPDRTLAHKDENCRGVKRMKQRITVLLCCNSTGTDNRRLLIIGKSAKPRCFRNFSPYFYCTYTSNSKAWMTSSIFQEWLLQFNKQLVSEGRRILMLLDNATSHCVPNDGLSNIKIHFLPPNMTASLQPLDSGIIKSFKAQYRKLQPQKMVELADAHLPTELGLDYAVRYCKMAWDSVSP